ncbi:uncharacterized protein RSE6_09986 [Rhynchosporium secalis]|uniref:Alpha/beta hydrolase fold-3 domain-containing protein n=1 Tax=Rhynchosporium secalis TaxID=38038 RepID=A0A1E1MJE3_RHYSE|nr:uncharacterized protein RSE6_09986 [Rhynchosporium secalis]
MDANASVTDTLMPSRQLGIAERLIIRLVQLSHHLVVRYKHTKTTALRPSYCKVYPSCPWLEHRVFLPPSDINNAGNTKKRHPLMIDIHGGGFILGAPSVDDPYCRSMADNCSMIVISIDYRKAPDFQFPTAHDDCLASALAILDDPDLLIDHDNLFIGGQSAGGNLALSTSRNEQLRGKFKGLVIWYPVVDWTTSMKTRAEFCGKTHVSFSMQRAWEYCKALYIPAGVDLASPVLSPIHATSESFPRASFFICGSDDLLGYDTLMMADKLAGNEPKVHNSTRLVESWRAGDVVWAQVHGHKHAFNEMPLRNKKEEVRRQDTLRDLFGRILLWLEEQIAAPAQHV